MEEQEQPSVSVKDLLARMSQEESDIVLGGRSRRRRPGTNSVSVGDLTGEIPVVREGAPRTHRAEQANRKWSGWSKREDPDAHLDERDREWDFRVLSGEIERLQDEDPSSQAEDSEELNGGSSVYREDPRFQGHSPKDLAPEHDEHPQPAPAEESAFEAAEPEAPVEQLGHDEAAVLLETAPTEPDEPHTFEPAPHETEPESSEHHDWFAEPGTTGAQLTPLGTAWDHGADGEGSPWHDEVEPEHDGHEEKPHKRVSAFKADQLERAREVFEKRKSHGEAIHRTGFLGAVDKIAAVRLPAWASIALQFVVGFLVGAVLFWVFRQLWRSDYTVFAAVLAVLTIAVLVLGVRWVRGKNDWTSMGVAGLVGAWVCFGPLAILLLGR